VAIDNREWEPQPAGIPSLPPGIPLSPEARAQLGPAPPAPKAGGERRGASRAGKYVPIPDRYYAADTSGIKFTVKGGPQTETIELTD